MFEKLKDKLKNSYLVVNKLYTFVVFILLSISNFALAVVYFFITLYRFIKKLLTSSVPLEVKGDFRVDTHIYKKTEEKDLLLDIYYPNNYNKETPLVYFCHGGGWISGYRDQPNNVSWCRLLASRGFIVASIDYRYGYKNTMMDLLSDYNDGLLFLKENHDKFHIDRDNIVLMGLSAGAHLSLLYATYITHENEEELMKGIKSVVAYYPPANLEHLIEKDNKSIIAKFGARQTIKDSPYEFDDPYVYYSPLSWVSDNMIPVFLAHGKEDETVPFKSSVEFARSLKKHNVDYEFAVHKTADHTFDTSLNDYATINIIEKTVRFINKSTK